MQVQKVVLMKFPKGLSSDEQEQLLNLCRSLKAIPGVRAVTIGQDQGEGTRGFAYCFLVRFDSEEAYVAYEPHPAHLLLRDFVVKQEEHDVIGFNFPVLSGNEWLGVRSA
ncbi:MAG TPA: Dabb family protein [Candidatus Limnocylindria bacterium]|jgi:hypothetical protein|nr:Dabb family protein [Candidatus Limnocylindria bacterium]